MVSSYNKEAKKENQIKSKRNNNDCKMDKGQAHNEKIVSTKKFQIRFNRFKKNFRKRKSKKLYLYQQ